MDRCQKKKSPVCDLDPTNDQSNWTRRGFLQTAGAGLVAAIARPAGAAFEDAGGPLIIDCHPHIYSADEKTYPPIEKPYRPPAGKGTLDHLRHEALTVRSEAVSAGVRFATAIHTSTFYRWDNRFTADASRDNRDFLVGVCTLNPDDPASPKVLEDFVKSSNVRGLRSIAAASGKFDDPGVEALWETAERLGIPVNALTTAERKGEIAALAKRHPTLRVVIDHCLYIKAGPTLEPTLRAMRELAELPNVFAKLSFIPDGSGEAFPCRDMHEPCLAVIKAFGPGRCVWGSCFPCELWCPKVTYADHLDIFTHALGLDDKARRAILGETAQKLWFGGRGPDRKGVPEISEDWNILLEGFGGTPHDRTWFRLALAADGTMHAANSRRNSYRPLFHGKLTGDEMKRFYNATSKILTGSGRPHGRTEDGWRWSMDISSNASTASARYDGHASLPAANPAFEELLTITNAHVMGGNRFPE
jgi:predicted TIM-barrel fold metal-dependent hydrolase